MRNERQSDAADTDSAEAQCRRRVRLPDGHKPLREQKNLIIALLS
jgi:hypothetical protein